ncbi:protein phosphatase 2C-like domain-containing protein 1 [Actinia tenebrosa]|uniref:Protein phosphatase 2C-like domain-containing protein 1 n=1 Tax=Actinia tenebrosa TaxID=6105 RepID=A0A6P8J5K3_ACTTE|nr:protein phosphatase 2C-like domain-containing protein 1 [Actinia tenebrosa]
MASALEDIKRSSLDKDAANSPIRQLPTSDSRPLSSNAILTKLHLPPIDVKESQKSLNTVQDKDMIKILCLKCEEEVKVRELPSHREFHFALSLFKYTMETLPFGVKQLLKRRRALIKRLNETATSENPVSIKKLSRLNIVYELLKATIEGTKTISPEVENYKPNICGYSTRLSCALAFGVCEERNERWRSKMEDRYSYQDYFCNDPQSGFFAVYDGYNGAIAAEKCARYFHEILSDKIEPVYRSDSSHKEVENQIVTAFKETYDEMDKFLLFGVNENSRNRWSGCSALTCLLRGNNLYVANAGTVRAILCKGDGSVVQLSRDHTPLNKKERKRITKNGQVSTSEKSILVNGLLSSTRGLGNHGDPSLKSVVIHHPDVKCVPLDESDQFLIFASNGIWEVFDEQEVLLLLDDIIPELDVKAVVRRMQKSRSNKASRSSGNTPGSEKMKENPPTSEPTDQNKHTDNLENFEPSEDIGKSLKDTPSSGRTISFIRREEKSVALAKALSERLVESALLAGCKDNVTVGVVLLKGCPLQMFLLPSIN